MAIGTVIVLLVIALGIGLIVGSLVVEGMPKRFPPGPIFLSGFYILCWGSLAAVVDVILSFIRA